jgi:hypothetical protein
LGTAHKKKGTKKTRGFLFSRAPKAHQKNSKIKGLASFHERRSDLKGIQSPVVFLADIPLVWAARVPGGHGVWGVVWAGGGGDAV